MTNYSSSELLVSGTGSKPVVFNFKPNGNLTVQGKTTIKHTHFQKASSSNFNYVSLSGSASKTLEQVSISGSQYGLLVNNVPSQALTLTNVSGSNNNYSTIKATNSSITVNGFTSQDAQAQDALSAYTNSSVHVEGHFTAYDHLIGIRSAYSSMVTADQDVQISISLNTRGIHAYASSTVFLATTLHELVVTGNTRQDLMYGLNPFDVYAVDGSTINLFGVADPTAITQYKDATSSIRLRTPIGGTGPIQLSRDQSVTDRLESARPQSFASKEAFMQAYYEAKREKRTNDFKNLLKANRMNSRHEIRSKAQALQHLNAAQEGDFTWVDDYPKRAKLRSYTEEDERMLAEQLLYYYLNQAPDADQAAYWLEQLSDLGHDGIESGLFQVLYDAAAFPEASTSSGEDVQAVVNPTESGVVQAYPNPFNPATVLQFTLKTKANVRIQVYDITGRLVQTLTDAPWQSGTHSVSFDASRLASGVYLARTQILENGKLVNQTVTKLLLVK